MRGIGPCQREFARDGERVLVGALKHERSGVSHERRVEASGNIAINGNAGDARESINEFCGGHHVGINPIDVAEIAAADVVVDINKETLVESLE